MRAQFLVVQNTIPEALSLAKSVSPEIAAGLSEGAVNQVVLPALILPPGMFAAGGGCGCHFGSPFVASWVWVQLLCVLMPVPLLLYYRRRRR